jgi:hypothetical protein
MTNSLSSALCAFAGLLCLAPLVGCAKNDRPPLGGVHGTVTLDGQPLAGAIVTFEPVGPGRGSIAMTDAQGRYELIYIRNDKGAKVGAHRVQITTSNANAGKPELLPPRYNAQTTLSADVKAGDNEINFALASNGLFNRPTGTD